jgi:hypothetical protein
MQDMPIKLEQAASGCVVPVTGEFLLGGGEVLTALSSILGKRKEFTGEVYLIDLKRNEVTEIAQNNLGQP